MIENHLPHLHYFWLVAKNKSFTKAALALRISQSAVSFQIKKTRGKIRKAAFFTSRKKQSSLNTKWRNIILYLPKNFSRSRTWISTTSER